MCYAEDDLWWVFWHIFNKTSVLHHWRLVSLLGLILKHEGESQWIFHCRSRMCPFARGFIVPDPRSFMPYQISYTLGSVFLIWACVCWGSGFTGHTLLFHILDNMAFWLLIYISLINFVTRNDFLFIHWEFTVQLYCIKMHINILYVFLYFYVFWGLIIITITFLLSQFSLLYLKHWAQCFFLIYIYGK